MSLVYITEARLPDGRCKLYVRRVDHHRVRDVVESMSRTAGPRHRTPFVVAVAAAGIERVTWRTIGAYPNQTEAVRIAGLHYDNLAAMGTAIGERPHMTRRRRVVW